jgi:hypothetical protein
LKGAAFSLLLIGFGIGYLVMGNTPGRFVGIALIALGGVFGVATVRGFAKRFAKPS